MTGLFCSGVATSISPCTRLCSLSAKWTTKSPRSLLISWKCRRPLRFNLSISLLGGIERQIIQLFQWWNRLPDDVYVKSLERAHAPIVYQHWPFSPSTQVEHMADEIDRHPSAGLFLKENDQLVSWAMAHPPMGISRLFTLPAHRRKGYASLVMVYMSKRMAQSGYIPFSNIRIDNSSSVTFFESLGFQKVRRRYMINKRPHNCFNVKIIRAKGNRWIIALHRVATYGYVWYKPRSCHLI